MDGGRGPLPRAARDGSARRGPARQFAGRFEVRSLLGAGSFGAVYVAYDRVRRQEVALKELVQLTPDSLYRFKHEFRRLADIVHPNLVTLFGLHAEPQMDRWALAMELVPGARSFRDFTRPPLDAAAVIAPPSSMTTSALGENAANEASITRTVAVPAVPARSSDGHTVTDGPLGAAALRRRHVRPLAISSEQLRAAIVQLTDAVRAVHDAGFLHRDLKPSNVLFDRRGRLVVCDFGLIAPDETRDERFCGTPTYAAPEQLRGERLSPAADWYAVGVILYEALTGRLPAVGPLARLVHLKEEGPARRPRDIAPGVDQDLERLCLDLLAANPADRPRYQDIRSALSSDAGPVPRSRVQTEHLAYVGRQRERQALRAALVDARARATVTVCLSGKSGLGKSSLMAVLAREARTELDAQVFSGRCYDTESVPFKAVDGVVDSVTSYLIDHPELQPEIASGQLVALATLFPVLRRTALLRRAHVDLEGASAPMAAIRIHEAALTLAALLHAIARTRPVVVTIDDVQWADDDSELFLRELCAAGEAPGLLVVLAFRPDGIESSAPLARLRAVARRRQQRYDVRDLELGPLSASEATELAQHVGVCAGEEAGNIVRNAEGSPLFVIELAHARIAGELDDNSSAEVSDIDALLTRRILRMPEEERQLLQAAALTARPQPLSVLGQALSLESEARTLAALRAARMIRIVNDRDVEMVATYHDRVRETAASLLDPDERRRVHRRLARVFEAAGDPDAEALAIHWRGAGHPRRAAEYSLRAADSATRARAHHRAAAHYERALSDGDFDADTRRRIELALAEALAACGAPKRAAGHYLAVAAAAGTARRDLAVHCYGQALVCYQRAGCMDDATRLLRRRDHGLLVPRSRARALATIAIGRGALWLAERRAFVPRATCAHDPGETRRLQTLNDISQSLGAVDPIAGYAIHTTILRRARWRGDLAALQMALQIDAVFAAALRGQRAQGTVHRRMRQLASINAMLPPELQRGAHHSLRTIAGLIMFVSLQRFHDAAVLLDEHRRVDAGELITPWLHDLLEFYALNAYAGAGNNPVLGERLPAVLQHARDTGNEYLRKNLGRSVAVSYYLSRDDIDTPARLLQDAAPAATSALTLEDAFYQLACGELQAYTDPLRAWERLSTVWRRMRRTAVARTPAAAITIAYYAARSAIGALAQGRGDRAELMACARRVRRYLDRQVSIAPSYAAGASAVIGAGLAAAEGDREAAVAGLSAALHWFEDCQLGNWHASVAAVLASAVGGDLGSHLSRRAREQLTAEGIVNRDPWVRLYCPLADFDLARR